MTVPVPVRIIRYSTLRPLLRDLRAFPTSTCLMQMPRFLFPPDLERLNTLLPTTGSQRLVPTWNYVFPHISHQIVRVVNPAYISYNGCVRATTSPYDMLEDVEYYIYTDHPDRKN